MAAHEPITAGIPIDLSTFTCEHILPEAFEIPLNAGVATAARELTASIGCLN